MDENLSDSIKETIQVYQKKVQSWKKLTKVICARNLIAKTFSKRMHFNVLW